MQQVDLLLITPPFVQLNTPYPATPSLKGFLQGHGYGVAQLDLSIECILKLLSREGLKTIFEFATGKNCSSNAKTILRQKDQYIRHIDAVINFLQDKNPTFAYAINNGILPEASRFEIQQDLEWHFGSDGIQDKAKFLATLFIEDIGDFISECVDERFGFSRYAERAGLNAVDYNEIIKELQLETPITQMMCDLLDASIKKHNPKIVGFTIPFPGNLIMALKSALHIKKKYPEISIVLGGGYVNTELRSLNEPRLFELSDYVCLDDGELSLLKLLDFHIKGKNGLVRTFMLENGEISFFDNKAEIDFDHKDVGTPDYSDLPIKDYFSVSETTNSMHNLWTNGKWNKIMLAHGCYWHKCSFCDTSLDYINRYSSAEARILCDRIEAIIKQTGERGFHFVDEAAPPSVLKNLAKELISRNINITWWTNIRFEKSFNEELCLLLAESGCIAVSGGLEVASDRLLKKMNKGISIEDVTRVTSNFQNAGIMIHAYLMYGFPTQTEQETIDSLEIVRQLFGNKLIQSAYWHLFTMTVHSSVGKNPEQYGVEAIPLLKNSFTQNGCLHLDNKGCNHEKFGDGLRKALYNFIHDNGIDFNLQEWFDFEIPETTISRNYLKKILKGK